MSIPTFAAPGSFTKPTVDSLVVSAPPPQPTSSGAKSNGKANVNTITNTAGSKKGKGKVSKELKDPSAPKKPQSSFFLFAAEERPKVLAELGNISAGEIGKELGRRWSGLDAVARRKFEATYAEAKAKYGEEMKNYVPSSEFLEEKAKKLQAGLESEAGKYFSFLEGNWRQIANENAGAGPKDVQDIIWDMWIKKNGGKGQQKKVKKAKDPMKPKKPLTAYFLFLSQMRKEVAKRSDVSMSNKDLLVMVGEKWGKLDLEMKQEFEKQAEKLKSDYLVEMEKYNKKKATEN